MMKDWQEEKLTGEDGREYGQLSMDISALEYARSIDAMDDGYQQMRMSVKGSEINMGQEPHRNQSVSGDTIYMGSISVYPPKMDNMYPQGNFNQGPMGTVKDGMIQPYYDANTGIMYMPMYPMYPYQPQGTQPNMQKHGAQPMPPMMQKQAPQPMPQPMHQNRPQPAQPLMGTPMAQSIPNQAPPMNQNPAPQPMPQHRPQLVAHPAKPVPQKPVPSVPQKINQQTTMYPATSVTKMVDIFGEDKKYSKALIQLQAESEYKVAVHANTMKNAQRYTNNFAHMDKTRQLLNWNWGAFFMGPLWYAYRKMPIRAFILLVSLLYGISTPYALLVVILSPLFLGCFSDRVYKGHIDRLIDKQFMMEKNAKERHINSRGGASVIYPVMFILITMAMAIGTYEYIVPQVEIVSVIFDDLIHLVGEIITYINSFL